MDGGPKVYITMTAVPTVKCPHLGDIVKVNYRPAGQKRGIAKRIEQERK
jgi:hypothetical protein